MERPEWIEVGRIARPHGIRGELRVVPDTDNPERFRPGARLHAQPPRGAGRRELEIEYLRGDAGFPIVSFVGIEDRDEAAGLKGWSLVVRGSDLPELEEGEYYPWELTGLSARLPGGQVLGTVVELLDAPANDVLVIAVAGGERILVPFVHETVPEIDLAGGRLTVAAGVVPPEFLPEEAGPPSGANGQPED